MVKTRRVFPKNSARIFRNPQITRAFYYGVFFGGIVYGTSEQSASSVNQHFLKNLLAKQGLKSRQERRKWKCSLRQIRSVQPAGKYIVDVYVQDIHNK